MYEEKKVLEWRCAPPESLRSVGKIARTKLRRCTNKKLKLTRREREQRALVA